MASHESTTEYGPCFECGEPAEHAHHVVPRSLGGTKTVPLCASCHGRVHDGILFKTGHVDLIRAGIQRAKARGVPYVGKQFTLTPGEHGALRAIAATGQYDVARIARAWGIGRATAYRYIAMPPRPE